MCRICARNKCSFCTVRSRTSDNDAGAGCVIVGPCGTGSEAEGALVAGALEGCDAGDAGLGAAGSCAAARNAEAKTREKKSRPNKKILIKTFSDIMPVERRYATLRWSRRAGHLAMPA